MGYLKHALILTTALFAPGDAQAAPVAAFFAGALGLGGPFLGSFLGTGLVGGAYAVGAFLTSSTLGSLLLSAGVNALLTPKSRAPKIEDIRVNTRLDIPPRWQIGGKVPVGGAIGIFCEYDSAGNLWYICAHGDAEITSAPEYYLDNINVTLDSSGDVITDEFCLTDKFDQYEGTGTRVPVFRIYTVTPTAANAVGAKPAAFTAAFPGLPANFLLAGISYTIIRGIALKPQHYAKGYKWRGGFGLGEPSVVCYANYSRMYDPRNPAHDIGNSATWTATDGNPAIVWAWFRTNPYGRARPMSEINWDKVAEQADICDIPKLNRSGIPVPNYRCGVAFPDNRPRQECEQEILLTCDGFVGYDDEGRAFPIVGHYVTPTLTFSAERDILGAQTQVVDDGENAVDGVIVEYLSPDHAYTPQPCAPWINPIYNDGGAPNFQTIQISGCQDHSQAVRLAKAIGLRSAAQRRAGLQTTIKGILAKSVRTVDLQYDAEFSGSFEIVTPVKEDAQGISCAFAVVPIDADRYDLAPGEEGIPPQVTPALSIDNTLANATGVVIASVPISTANGAAVRLEAVFNAPTRADRAYRFRYAPTGQITYEYFTTDMDLLKAYSAIVKDGQAFDVSWQTVTASGRAGAYSAPVTIIATANPTPPPALVAASVVGGTGQATVSFTTANSVNQAAVAIYRNTVATFGTATLIDTVVAIANTSGSSLNTGLVPGTYYFWARPRNGSGVFGPVSATLTATVT